MKTGVFTIIAKNYLAYARVLMNSVRQYAPEARRFVILVDQVGSDFELVEEPFEVVLSEDLELPNSRWFHFKYTIVELSTAVKPYAAEFLFHRHGLDRLLYFDPDIRYYAPMEPLWKMLDGANILLTPHLTRPLDDAKYPGDLDILRAGSYNLGFIGLARSAETFEFLKWWQAKLYDHCVVDIARGLFVDQRWIDLVPGIFDGVRINREPGYNVAYWNIKHRRVERTGGQYLVNGKPLYFFHYSGFDPNNPAQFSRHQNRFRLEDLNDALQLIEAYRSEILNAGYAKSSQLPYAYGRFSNGFPIPDIGRPMHLESPEITRKVSDPFSEEGYRTFEEVWNEPVISASGERLGVTRLAYRIYRTRADVQAVMPDVLGEDRIRFLEWILTSGKREHGLDNTFLAPVWDALDAVRRHARGGSPRHPAKARGMLSPQADHIVRQTQGVWIREGASEGERNVGLNELIRGGKAGIQLTRLAQAIYDSRDVLRQRMPDPYGRDAAAFLTWFLTYGKLEYNLDEVYVAPIRQQWLALLQSVSWTDRVRYEAGMKGMEGGIRVRSLIGNARARIQFARAVAPLRMRNWAKTSGPKTRVDAGKPVIISGELGLNVVGHLHAETGVGESARSALMGAQAAGLPVHAKNLSAGGPYRREDRSARIAGSNGEVYGVSVFHVNADETPRVFDTGEVGDVSRGYNIGYWAWELEEFPDRYLPAFTYYREIWTPSTFCQEAIAKKSPIPVIRVPHAVKVDRPEGMGRVHFGLAGDELIFLTIFDMLSVFERKNPMAVVRAFARAFGNESGRRLVVKINHAEHGTAHLERLREAARGHNVNIVTGTMTRGEINALIGCCDCLVSLHRSEGFGLTLAEAMYQGKPVIATAYSGNVDFTRPENAMPVSYKLCPVGKGCDPYPEDSMWAEPDVEEAARHMRVLADDSGLRARIAGAGRDWVMRHLSAEAVGRLARNRLERIVGDQRGAHISGRLR